MKKILTLIIITSMIQSAWSFTETNNIKPDTLSFKSAVWDNSFNMFFMKDKVSDLTKNEKAVIIYFFDICWG